MDILTMRIVLFVLLFPILAFARSPELIELTPLEHQWLTTPDELETSIGNSSAPVTIYNYSSFTCPHCSTFFSKVLPRIKENYIDKGHVRFVYRDFPTDKVAFQASMLLHCDSNVDKYSLAKLLYDRQDSWLSASSYAEGLANLAEIIGISRGKYQQCLFDKELESKLLSNQLMPAKNLKINATPTIFINGKRYKGSTSFYRISEVIDSELAKANNH